AAGPAPPPAAAPAPPPPPPPEKPLPPGEVHHFTGHRGAVRAVAFGDRDRLVSAGDDHTVRVWDAQTGASVQVLDLAGEKPSALALAPDGRHFLFAAADKTLRLREV